jgi:NAD-dependent SIR2 family protein deacetylase
LAGLQGKREWEDLKACFIGKGKPKMKNLEERIRKLSQWMFMSEYLIISTGAGISTESGLPDFRGPDGIWTRQAKGLPTKSRPFTSVEPNAGHRAIVELQHLGKLKFLISQNVDNLHLRSGIWPERLAELHGNVTKLRCQRCQAQVDKSIEGENCFCGGRLVSSVVNFGDPLPQRDLEESFRHSRYCDLFIVVGSSLVVSPANDMPKEAVRSGDYLVIINQGETPMDRSCHLRFDEKVGEVLPPAIDSLKALIKKESGQGYG